MIRTEGMTQAAMDNDTMVEVTPEARKAAADLLDEVSSLLGDTGIGQVADLIRDGEYDEHDATLAFARFERDILARSRSEVGCTIPADHPLAKGLRTSQKALDAIKRQEQANIAGYLAMRDMPIGSVAADARHQSGRTGAGEALVPINTTPAMRQAGADQLFGAFNDDWGDDADAIWKAMIAAALSQSTAGEALRALREDHRKLALFHASGGHSLPGDVDMLAFIRDLVVEARSDYVSCHESDKVGDADPSGFDEALRWIDAALTPSALSGEAGEGE